MPLVTVSSKHQVTLPVEIVRALDIQPGEKLVMDVIDDRIVAIRQPESWVSYMRGTAHGLYGENRQQMDRYVAEERASWNVQSPGSDVETFVDYYIACEGKPARLLIDTLAASSWPFALTADEIVHRAKLVEGQVNDLVRTELGPRGWVKSIGADGKLLYRLRRDLAEEVQRATAA